MSLRHALSKMEPMFWAQELRGKLAWRLPLAVCVVTFVFVGASASCGNSVPQLRTADVPVKPLVRQTADPAELYAESFPLQVAVLWTDHTTSPLAAIHALKEMGIPFFITRDLRQALRHRLVLIYPGADSKTFTEAQAQELVRFTESGGTIFAQNILAGDLKSLFGFRDFLPSRRRYHVAFAGAGEPALKYLDRPEEREIRLGRESYPEIIWSNGYVPDPKTAVLARFEDGTAALLENSAGQGKAYLLGLSLVDVLLRSQSNRDYDAERHYVNAFEPGADVWMLILRAWYETYARDWVRAEAMPDGKRSALLLSHDVDWEYSFEPMKEFVRLENANHTHSTFFIQTKYVSDANSKSFFFGSNLDILRELKSQGLSLGSHSIIHSRAFNKFDLGTGSESFANYRPHALDPNTAADATVFGEVKVSKELLDGEIPGQQTVFFRAGHLRVPQSLPEALERCGYQFDSSFTADDVLSNFPYALPLNLGLEEDSEIYEFPVTFEDEEAPPLYQRITQALDVIQANADNGALNVILIHSNESNTKGPAEEELLHRLPGDVSSTDMLTFAKFWRARDRLRWSLKSAGSPSEATLEVTSGEPIVGLTFGFGRAVAAATGGASITPDRRHIILPAITLGETVSVRVQYAP